jgi:GrpB-like predicted nucleotidyltransferase (UPF0157 family)/streptomycin 6-kinase
MGKANAIRRRRVVVVDYDPAWPQQFEKLRARIWPAIADVALAVEHVGSTSVPGLAAKPIIDMSIVVRDRTAVPLVVARLAPLGYVHRGDLGVEDRDAFDSPPDLPDHHLYACSANGLGLRNQLAVREYLRAHAGAAAEYAALKKQLADTFPHDIGSYVAGKTDFVVGVLRAAGLPADCIDAIERANRSEETSWRKTFLNARALATHVQTLRAFGEHRAAAVLGTEASSDTALLERVRPGGTLASLATEDEAMQVIVNLFGEGWPPLPANSLAEPLPDFAAALVSAARADEKFARAAVLLGQLIATTTTARLLLHGDLHYDNVLSSGRTGYVLIDPKGVAGDPAFDVGYLVSRPAPTARDSLPLAEAIDRRLSFLPDALGVDRRRTRAFAYVAAALSAAWAREDEDPGEKLYVEAMQILEPYI